MVLDDSVIARKRSKVVELLAFIHDHVIGKSVRGFNLLMLGWTDGFSFIPVAFNMLSSAKQEKRFREPDSKIDRRTNGYKARTAAIMQKPDAAIAMIESALSVGIPAEHILMDTWFTNEPFIKRILNLGVDVIGMLKNNKQMYHFNGGLYNLDNLASYFARMNTPGDILGSVTVKTRRESIPVRLVFVRNRNKRSEYIIILEWLRRKNNDPHSLGELFFLCYDDVRDIELVDALEQLITIMTDGLANGTIRMDESVRRELLDWYVSQPAFLFGVSVRNRWKKRGSWILLNRILMKCQQLYNLCTNDSSYKGLQCKTLWEV